MTKARKTRVFRPSATKTRKKGVRKPNVGFRCPLDLYEYLMGLKAKGTQPTEVISWALRMAKETSERMGDEWWEVERRANVAGISPGATLAQLALNAMAAERAGKPKK